MTPLPSLEITSFNAVLTARFLRSAEKMDASNDKKMMWVRTHSISIVNLNTGLIRFYEAGDNRNYYHLSTRLRLLLSQRITLPKFNYEFFAKRIIKELKSTPTYVQECLRFDGNGLSCFAYLLEAKASFIQELWNGNNLIDLISNAEDLSEPCIQVFTVCHKTQQGIYNFAQSAIDKVTYLATVLKTAEDVMAEPSKFPADYIIRLVIRLQDEYKKNSDFNLFVETKYTLDNHPNPKAAAKAILEYSVENNPLPPVAA